jgi:hypothetical protein
MAGTGKEWEEVGHKPSPQRRLPAVCVIFFRPNGLGTFAQSVGFQRGGEGSHLTPFQCLRFPGN